MSVTGRGDTRPSVHGGMRVRGDGIPPERRAGPRVRPRFREDPRTSHRPDCLAEDRAASRWGDFAIPAGLSATETFAYPWRKPLGRPMSGPFCSAGMRGVVPMRLDVAGTRRLRQWSKVSPKIRRKLGHRTRTSPAASIQIDGLRSLFGGRILMLSRMHQ